MNHPLLCLAALSASLSAAAAALPDAASPALPDAAAPVGTNAVENAQLREHDTDEIDLEEIDDSADAAKKAVVQSAAKNSEFIDISCDEATLADILRQFRKTTRANIIYNDSTNLQRRVSTDLRHVRWDEALQSILSMRGFRLQPRGDIYFVNEDKTEEPVLTRTFTLNHASADEMAALFNANYATKDPTGKVVHKLASAFPGANVVVVTATEKVITDCEAIIKSVDKAVAQIYIEARFLELSNQAMRKLGLNWQALESWKLTAKEMHVGWERNHGTAAVYPTDKTDSWYTPKNMQKTGENSNESTTYQQQNIGDGKSALDYTTVDKDGKSTSTYYTPQKYVKTGSTSSSTSTFTDMASGKSALDYTTQNYLMPGTIGKAAAAGLDAADMAWQNAYGFSGQLSADEFSLAMSAFESLGEGKMFSNPKIIVSNGKEATVDMTTKEPNVSVTANYTGTSSQNMSISTELEVIPGEDKLMFAKEAFFSYGISLTVKPRISPDGLISVEIVPTISEQSDRKKVEGASASAVYTTYPVISVKRLTTEFTMKDGATAVIGGLSRTSEQDVDNGIPYLRKLPWIGQKLFGWTSREKVQNEIIVCVTVGIAHPESLPTNIGLPKNAILGREYVEGRRLEPGDRSGHSDAILALDMETLDNQRKARAEKEAAEAAKIQPEKKDEPSSGSVTITPSKEQ